MKTVAYIDDRAVGLAALVPLACRDIVFKKSARMGDVRQMISGRNGRPHDLSEGQIASLAEKAALLARPERPPRGRRRRHGRSQRRDRSRPRTPRPAARGCSAARTWTPSRGRFQAPPDPQGSRARVLTVDGRRRRARTAWARSSPTTESSRPCTACAARRSASTGPAGSTRS